MVERRQPYGGVESVVAALQAEVSGLKRLLEEVDKRYAQQFEAQEKAVSAALAAAEKAVGVAEQNAEKWRGNANEWRGAMDDRERDFVHKEQLSPIQKEIDELKRYENQSMGKTVGMEKFWGYIVAAAGSGGVAAFLLDRLVNK